MLLAQVIGQVVSTAKHNALSGQKLLMLRPLSRRSRTIRTVIALDAVGAGPGEIVYYCRGREASFPWLPREVPTDAAVIGIVDPTPNAPMLERYRIESRNEQQY